jgi:hypothetical protein
MKVLRTTETQLVLEERPWLLGLLFVVIILSLALAAILLWRDGEPGWAVAMAAAAVGAWFLMRLAVERVWLVLDRAAGTVEFRRRGLARSRRDSFPLRALERVELQRSLGDDGDETYRLAIWINGEPRPLPMTGYYQSGKGSEICVAAALAWLARTPI